MSAAGPFFRIGFTLIELLIVIGIISLLLQLALPAIEMSRETARQAQCSNNLRQIALSFQLHHDSQGHYPSSGWGWQWVGHPDRGFGPDQPGGWAYNILPFIDQQAIHEIGAGLSEQSDELRNAIMTANSTPIPLFSCPSRRLPRAWPMIRTGYDAPDVGFSPLLPKVCLSGDGERCRMCRSDYGVNSGNINYAPGNEAGPPSVEAAATWKWRYSGADGLEQNGVSHQRSKVTLSQITDGTTRTYCVTERYIPPKFYSTGEWSNDDLSLFAGHDGDTNLYTASAWKPGETCPPGPDYGDDLGQHHGSAHPTVFNIALCDGSVKAENYDIDPEVHRLKGGRNDAK
jgi:prepilin-type N-terminal cleavage/methylation domain-containing protein